MIDIDHPSTDDMTFEEIVEALEDMLNTEEMYKDDEVEELDFND